MGRKYRIQMKIHLRLCTYTLNVGRIEIAEVGDNRDVVHLR